MAIVLPACLKELVEFLSEAGFSKEDALVEPLGFENICIIWCRDSFRVRLVRERGDWSVDLNEQGVPDEWYDLPLIKSVLDQSPCDAVDAVDEQVAYLRREWIRILDSFRRDKASQMHDALAHERRERTRRRFPQWM